ncbi:hypothetical protein [Nonomuraea guangzhouensis]|uniref:Uncharacterized protein n=1 Tax=Nonomuraea guangzhouensis TaxID=1291555 RepID=A0ABW4GWT2_9ACTN|nr:hypothetical protein [Nonomuraea guangzhouensis]
MRPTFATTGCTSTTAGGRHEEARESWRESLELLREARLLAPVEVAGYLAQPVPDTPEPIRNQL